MPRIKVARKSTAVDMTAMCDVAFLLLTFFILTATARQPDVMDIKIPTSTAKFNVPDKDIAILTIGNDKVFLEVVGRDVKARTLELIGEEYGIAFTPEEIKKFSVIASFGMPIGNLKQYINMNPEERKKSGLETYGIPNDSTANNQLARWINQARTAVRDLHGQEMRISIKGNAEEEYPTVKRIIDILQRQDLNKFSLITTPEGGE